MASTFKSIVGATSAGTRQMESIAEHAVKMAAGMDLGADVGAGGSAGGSLMGSGTKTSKRRYELFRSWVFVCIRAIAQRVSGQPICVGQIHGVDKNPQRRMVPGGTKTRSISVREKSVLPSSVKAIATRGQQSFEVFEQHAILDLLDNPNPAQGKHAFFFQTLINYYLTGLSYWVYGVGPEKKPEIWAVPSHWIVPKHDGGLFTGYGLKVSETSEEILLDPAHVGRFYFPDPSDLKCAVSPVETQMEAIVTDRYIQKTQETMFENGLFPAIVLKVGKNIGPDGKPMETRPVLSPKQRRTIIAGIRKVWGGVSTYGDPAIIDGLIEGIERLQTTPREMDFERSGEIVKKRIFQMFGVNPITVGEVTASNRAQAVEAEKNLASGVINPLCDTLSNVLTSMLGPLFGSSERLIVWIEEFAPIDAELELRRWTEARKNGDVTTDEFRAYVLNLPPMEEEEDEDESGAGEEDPAAEDPPADDEDPAADDGENIDGGADEQAGKGVGRKGTKGREPLSRGAIGNLHAQQVATTSKEVERVLARFFR
jgi:phage portal protein BeeE